MEDKRNNVYAKNKETTTHSRTQLKNGHGALQLPSIVGAPRAAYRVEPRQT